MDIKNDATGSGPIVGNPHTVSANGSLISQSNTVTMSLTNTLNDHITARLSVNGTGGPFTAGSNTALVTAATTTTTTTLAPFTDISASRSQVLALDNSNNLFVWGQEAWGQLGDGVDFFANYINTPYKLTTGYSKVFAGYLVSAGVKTNNTAWSWGINTNGNLGVNSMVCCKLNPTSIYGNHTFCKIAIGSSHSLGIDNHGKLWSWGSNSLGELGLNSSGAVCYSTPISVYGASTKTFCDIAVGYLATANYGSSFALDNHGKLWSWGNNADGQLGVNSTICYSTPIALAGYTFCKIDTMRIHVLALDYHYKLWSWGYNSNGQLGINNTSGKSTPNAACGNHTFCTISAGYDHSVGIDIHGKGWSWGGNNMGQLGVGSTSQYNTPTSICANHTFCNISAGYEFTVAIDNHSKVWGWGYNNYGQLADGSITCRCLPVSAKGQ